MYGLKIPAQLSRGRIQSHHAVGVQVHSLSVPAVEAVCGVSDGDEDQATFGIDGHRTPRAGARAILPAIRPPGFVARLAGPWHRMEPPNQFTGPGVKRPGIPAGPFAWSFLHRRPKNDQTLIDCGW